MVIMYHYYRYSSILPAFLCYYPSEFFVYRNITRLPRIVYLRVNIRIVRGIPHVMLEKPKKGVAKNIVMLVVDTTR
jgi:hypothetical protein